MSAAGYTAGYAQGRAQTLFGRVMGLVALTVGFATLGVYLGRNLGGAGWFVAWLIAMGCLVGLNVANARGNQNLALGLLMAFGLLIGAAVATHDQLLLRHGPDRRKTGVRRDGPVRRAASAPAATRSAGTYRSCIARCSGCCSR